MGEGFVGLGHFMDLIAFADRVALSLVGFQDFGCKCIAHRNAFAGIGKINDPAQRQRVLAIGRDFHRDLIGCATDAAGFGLDARLGVVHRALQDFNRVARGIFFGNGIERSVNDALRGALFATNHYGIDEARNERAVKLAVFCDWPFGSLTSAGHGFVKS